MTTETLPNWKILESLLKRDWWESELACRIFTGFVRYDYQGKGSSRTRLSGDCLLGISGEDFQNGKDDISPGSPLFSKIHEKLWDYQTLWKYAEHKKSPNNFRNEDEWSKEYCVSWALIKKIDIPWLDWAIEKRYLPAEIREDKKTKKSDTPMSDREEMRWKVLAAVFFEMLTDSDQANHHFKDAAQLGKVIDATYGVQFPNKGLRSRTLETKFAKLNGQLKELRS